MGLRIRSLNNVRLEQWKDCDRCGRRYPLSWLVYDYNASTGKTPLVCVETCVDQPAVPVERAADGRLPVYPLLPQKVDTRGGEDG